MKKLAIGMVAVAVMTMVGFAQQAPLPLGQPAPPGTDLKALGTQITEVIWNQHRLDPLGEFYAANVVRHVPEFPDPIVGLEANKGYLSRLFGAFPDSTLELPRVVIEGDWAAMMWVWTGTHTGPLPGLPPTGKAVRLVGISLVHVENGKAVEIWDFSDQLSLLQQLGVIPPLPPPPPPEPPAKP